LAAIDPNHLAHGIAEAEKALRHCRAQHRHRAAVFQVPWRDELAFKEAAPDHSLACGCHWLFIAACARRTFIVGASMLGVALAL
jgi:hypothetical protein